MRHQPTAASTCGCATLECGGESEKTRVPWHRNGEIPQSSLRIEQQDEQALGDYLRHLEAVRHRSRHTIRNYRRDIEGFLAFLAARGMAFDGAGREIAGEYLGVLRVEREVAPASIKRVASTIRAFYGWLDAEGRLPPGKPGDSILRLRSPKTDPPSPDYLSGDEARALVHAPDPEAAAEDGDSDDTERALALRDAALLELFLGAGLRVSEAAALDYADLDFANPRFAQLGKPARNAVAAWLSEGHPALVRGTETALFLNRFGARLSERSMQAIVENAGTAARIGRRVTPGLLRRGAHEPPTVASVSAALARARERGA